MGKSDTSFDSPELDAKFKKTMDSSEKTLNEADHQIRKSKAFNANFRDTGAFERIKDSMVRTQVTPGKWKSKDKIDGKLP